MNRTYQMPSGVIKSACLSASVDRTREPITRVLFQPGIDGRLAITATDGRCLFRWRDTYWQAHPELPAFAVDAKELARVAKGGSVEITVPEKPLGGDGDVLGFVDIGQGVATTRLPAYDATSYPDYTHVIPDPSNFHPGTIAPSWNAKYLGWLSDVAAALGGKQESVTFWQERRNGPALIVWLADRLAVGILMPMQNDGETQTVPSWYQQDRITTPSHRK